MIVCLDCPAPHQCAQEGECCKVGYEAGKAALALGDAEREKFEREHRGEKMTLLDFEKAVHKLLDEAVASGLEPTDLVDCGVAIIENTFLNDPASA